jgi:pimeloyl-ACP methyl ester carboxylesterase
MACERSRRRGVMSPTNTSVRIALEGKRVMRHLSAAFPETARTREARSKGWVSGRLATAFAVLVLVAALPANLAADSAEHAWSLQYGSPSGTGWGYGVSATSDGGALVTGVFQGTVDFGGGPLMNAGSNSYDIFVLKLDSGGNHAWSRSYGDAWNDRGLSVSATDDGGALGTGSFVGTVNFGGGPLTSAGINDVFVLKLDSGGNHVWSRRYGGTSYDEGQNVSETSDGGAVVTGDFRGTVNFGGGPLTSAGFDDIFVLTLDSGGNHVWSRRYGSTSVDYGYSVSATSDGGAAVTGTFEGTLDFGGGPLVSAGYGDIFVLKLDSGGNHVWSRRYGSTLADDGWSVAATSDGAALVTGTFQGTVDFGGGPLTSGGFDDVFVLKLDLGGSHAWSRSYGSSGYDEGYSVSATSDCVLATGHFSGTVDFGGGPLTSGGTDIFVLKLTDEEPAKVRGRVVDGFNERPIVGATVTVEDEIGGTVYSSTSASSGRFEIEVPGGSSYELEATHPGYRGRGATSIGSVDLGEVVVLGGPVELDTKTVVFVHGFLSSHDTWIDNGDGYGFAADLDSRGDYNPDATLDLVSGNWATWLGPAGSVQEQAQRLEDHLSSLYGQGIMSVDVVAHSMGGLVTRWYLEQMLSQEERDRPPIRKLIMLGTPNHGTELANETGSFLALVQYLTCGVDPVCGLLASVTDAPARLQLSAGSDFLSGLNYGAPGLAESNLACRTHQDETALSWNTQYLEYAGTVYTPGCGDLRDALGLILAMRTKCVSDQIVPANSVLLRRNVGVINNIYLTDESCQCESSHRTVACTQLTEDPCVVDVVHDALQAVDWPTSALCQGQVTVASGLVDSVGAPHELLVEALTLAPADMATWTAAAGDADSLVFSTRFWSGMLDVTLEDPGGRIITPDTAAVDPNVTYFEDGSTRSYAIAGGEPGEWLIRTDGAASPDTVWGLVTAAEYSSAEVEVIIGQSEITPLSAVLVGARLVSSGVPIGGAAVQATIADPVGAIAVYGLLDNGMDGDQVAGDGIYSRVVSGNATVGVYEVEVLAQGTYDGGLTLNREGEGFYGVAERPDLEVLAEDIELSPPMADSVTVVTVTATFRNLPGAADAESVRVRFIHEESQTAFGDTVLATVGAGSEVALSQDWDVEDGVPAVGLGVRLSVLGEPAEVAVGNNAAFAQLVVVGAPEIIPWDESEDGAGARAALRLEVFPNPVRGDVSIRFSVPQEQPAELAVFDVTGRLVWSLPRRRMGPGLEATVWNGRDRTGRPVATGIYFVRLKTDSESRVGRVALVR